MPYVATQRLRLFEDQAVKAGEEIPHAIVIGWSEAYLRAALQAGTVVFVPPQLLSIPGAELTPPSNGAGGRPPKKVA